MIYITVDINDNFASIYFNPVGSSSFLCIILNF